MGNETRGLPLRPTLLSVVVLLIVLVAGGIGALAYGSSSRIVSHLWSGYSQQISSSVLQRTLRYFEPALPYTQQTVAAAERRELPVGDPMRLLANFGTALDANAEFTWASFARDDGTYVAAHRTPAGDIVGAWRTPRADGRTTMRELRRTDAGDWVLGVTRDGDYDPRERPWFQNATEEGHWVEPFVFATVRQPGFMYVQRFEGGPGIHDDGVFAVEYEMSALSEHLADLQVGDHGRVYVVTHDGLVVGHPDGQTTIGEGDALAVAQADGHEDVMLDHAWQALQQSGHERGEIRFDEYLGMVEPFPASSGIDWRVIVVAPESDFFGEVHAQAWQTLGIALLAALLAVLFGAFFSNRISGSLRVIADELVKVGGFDLEPRDLSGAKSFVREVNDMRHTTERMKRSLRSFGKYVPKELVRELILSGEEAELGGRTERLTVLFSDIAGFTTVSESMTPDELVTVLAEYLDGMSDAIKGTGGTVDKFIGDAIMAFWGAPRPNADHALAACEGALAMKARLEELQAEWDERGLPRLDTRIGVNTGDVLVGNIGAPARLNYTVMGDPVNLGARLEALNKHYGTGILVGPETADAVKDAMVLRPLEWVTVKGKTQAVLIYELVGRKGEVDDAELAAIAAYEAALQAYRARRFAEAAAGFRDALAQYAELGREDVSAARMAERCDALEKEPPGNDWDGRTVMTSK